MKIAHIMLTSRCNIHCLYCYYTIWDERKDSTIMKQNTFNNVLKFLRQGEFEEVSFTGGEPLLHPDINNFIKKCHSNNIITSVNTNGVLLSKQKINMLVDAGLEKIAISVDSIEKDVHDDLRKGSKLEHILNMISYIKTKTNLRLHVICVLNNRNYDKIGSLLQFTAHEKINIAFQPVIMNDELRRLHKLDDFCTNDGRWKLFEKIIHIWGKSHNSIQYVNAILKYFKNKTIEYQPCMVKGNIAVFNPQGDIFPCFFLYDKCIGNINNQSTLELLSNMRILFDKIDDRECYKEECISCGYDWYGKA